MVSPASLPLLPEKWTPIGERTLREFLRHVTTVLLPLSQTRHDPQTEKLVVSLELPLLARTRELLNSFVISPSILRKVTLLASPLLPKNPGRFGLFLPTTARQQELTITLRAGMAMGPLLDGPSRPPVVSTRRCVLVRVLVESGMRIVTRLLLKLVPNVAYVRGRSPTVSFLIRMGLNVRTLRWRSAGVWPSTIGRLPTIILRVLYIVGLRVCLIPPSVDPTPEVVFAVIRCPTMNGPNSLTVTLPGRLYRRTPSLGFIMTMEWLEQLICPLRRPRWK